MSETPSLSAAERTATKSSAATTAVTSGHSHTPGPWSFEALCFDRKIAIKGGVTAYGRPYTIAHVNRPGSAYAGQDKANARLIAAAPDLLEALKAARAELREHYINLLECRLSATATDVRNLIARVDAAISKATGEQP